MTQEETEIPEQSAKKIEELEAKNAELILEIDTVRKNLLAEMENARKRMQREKIEMNRFAIENVISEFLEPLDQLENALSFRENMSKETAAWAQGFNMILGQFKKTLANHGIEHFSSEGQIFNPTMHEPIEVEETNDHPEGYIITEFVRGYKSGDRIVRAAKVKVAKPLKEVTENIKTNQQEE